MMRFRIYMLILCLLYMKKNHVITKEKEIGIRKNIKDNCDETFLTCHPQSAVDGHQNTYSIAMRNYTYDIRNNLRQYPYYWIQIDLTDIYLISRVLINIDPRDYFHYHGINLFAEIYIRNDNSTIFEDYNLYNKSLIDSSFIWNTTGNVTSSVYGRYLTVKYDYILPITEIQIFSQSLNVDKLNAIQSSTLYSKLIANFAIDNDLKTCAYTESSPSWWKIDLEKNYIIQEIEIYSASEYPGLFPLSISAITSINNKNDKLCNYFNGSYSTAIIRIIKCLKPTNGRFLTIKNTNNDGNLILCDVQIYAIPSNITYENCNPQFNTSNTCQIRHNYNGLQTVIIGVVVGVGLFILLTLIIILICYYKLKKSENTSRTTVAEELYETAARKLETSENVEAEHTYEELGNINNKLKNSNK